MHMRGNGRESSQAEGSKQEGTAFRGESGAAEWVARVIPPDAQLQWDEALPQHNGSGCWAREAGAFVDA
ncbi:hypothetical protein NDU88_003508 [Pleurodeles waltl]|uniref:Uncharacterized protein n=1 Tax=Pleurodeles waltl TaxID=8319 RepID=A0AAV7SFT7_PLEWA|nr:hypothetical protein NDU88_003508 [Pleurodeles waltl]